MSLGVLQGSSAFEDRRPAPKYLFLQNSGRTESCCPAFLDLIWKRARKNLDDTVGFGWIKR
jgi:hypothetical protein